ncbi:MAG: IS4 family transposase, partial [Atribacterota bacterium]
IFLYPLHRHWRSRLRYNENQEPIPPPSSLAPDADWVEVEFQGVNCGDTRLKKRFFTLVRDFYACPSGNIPQVCGSKAKTKACYRFFDHPEITMNTLLTPHYEATQRRVAQEPLVLVLQDTTFLNYQTHTDTEGLGPIGTSPEGVLGLILHDSLAVTPAGVPLGLVDIQCFTRDQETFGKKHQRKHLPIDGKESHRWLKSFDATTLLKTQCPQTTVVSIADREADIYDLFLRATRTPKAPKLLVRSFQKRALLDEDLSYLEKLQKEPSAGIQTLTVPRRKNRKARVANLSVRFLEVTLKPPKDRPREKPVTLWAVSAREEEPPPEGAEPIEWVLLTTMPVHTFQDACERIEWYCMRWLIEVYHRTLKSGCKIEERQLGSVARIENCLAIDLVVAWRIFFLTKLGRETPDVPCTVFFEEAEWKALVAYVTQNPIPPPAPPTLKEAIFMVAGLGGFLGRKSDGHPGTKSMWLGLQRLDDITGMWLVMMKTPDPQEATSHVSRKGRYG